MPTLTTTIQHSSGSFSHSNKIRKRNKRNPDWKRRSKTSLFADDMILYIENPKDSTSKLLELVNEWRKQWHPTPVLLPGKSHGQRSLVGCSPWDRKESDTTEWLPFHFSVSCIGEGNGNPLQCSCLENPRDGEAWWAAVYGVAQSRTQLKWLSSSSKHTKIDIESC